MNRHRWWFLGTFLVIAAGTLICCAFIPTRYTATAEVSLDCSAADASPRRPCARGRSAAEAALLTAPAIVARTAAALSATARQAIAGKAGDFGPERIAATLRAKARVRLAGGAAAAAVSYDDASPAVAAEIVNRLAAGYVAYRRQTGARTRRIERARDQADDAWQGLARARTAATTYRAAADPAAADELRRLGRDAASLDVRLAVLDVHEAAPAADAADTGADASVATLQAQLAQLTASRAKLQERYGPLHPDMIRMNARVAALIDRITAATARNAGVAAAARQAHERLDEAAAAAAERDARQALLDAAATDAAARYDRARRELQRAETLPAEGHDAQMVTPARLSAPQPLLDPSTVGTVGLLIALVGAGSAVAVRELGVPGLGSKAAAQRRLGLAVAGMIPEVPHAAGASASGTTLADLLLSRTEPAFGAAFARLDAQLGIGSNGTRPRSIAVTSAFEAEGKTTVSIGVARLAALAGLRVLLVDCDVRRPAATLALAPHARACLADVLAGQVDLAEARVRDAASGAWFLASGRAGPVGLAANGLVGSDAMRALIDGARDEYDLVVLDTAPVLALAETRAVAGFAERVLLVARWRTTPVKAIRLALNLLREAEARVAALVLTRVAA